MNKVLVSGSSGLVGEELVAQLKARGDEAVRLVRRKEDRPERQIQYDPEAPSVDAETIQGFDAIVHLAGAGIADKRWTDERRRVLRDSRIKPTRMLAETLARSPRPPRVFVCASAVGFYGDRGEEELTEASAVGHGFLADLSHAWEEACEPLRLAGVRVVNLRIGVVLSPIGGALKKMLPPFRLGVAGPLGNGRQWMSWIALDDVAGAIIHCIEHDEVRGPVNFGAPHPVRNSEFTKTLGRVLHRPAFFPAPGFVLKAMFGPIADEALLASMKMAPEALERSGYRFKHPELEQALRGMLERRM